MEYVTKHMRVRYQCNTCRKSWSKKERAIQHAKKCIYSPFSRACPSCRHEFRNDYKGWDCYKGLRPDYAIRNCSSWQSNSAPMSTMFVDLPAKR